MDFDWLPELISLSIHGKNDPIYYLEILYKKFYDDFYINPPQWYPEKRIALKQASGKDGRSDTFWHMISEGSVESERLPDFRRCEKISWPRPMMQIYGESQGHLCSHKLVWWESIRKGSKRRLLALPDFSYVLVLIERYDYIQPITAYCVEYNNRREKLRREFQKYWT